MYFCSLNTFDRRKIFLQLIHSTPLGQRITGHMTREQFKKLTRNNKPVFIDFYADWCEPCKILDTILEEIKPQLSGKVDIEKIDLDTHPELQSEFAIKSVPTLMIFKAGELMWRMPGFMMGDELVEKMMEFV